MTLYPSRSHHDRIQDVRSGKGKPRVLVIAGSYLPGVKGGGHIRSIAAMVHHLGGELDFFVLCRDRDSGDSSPYVDVPIGEWTEQSGCPTLYLERSQFTFARFRELLTEVAPDVVYLNNLYSIREAVVPALVARRYRPNARLVMAPRGCLDPGALSIKRTKKRVFLRLLRLTRLPRMMTWQATTPMEASFIADQFGPVPITVASNFPSYASEPETKHTRKQSGQLRLVFFSRVSPKKNLPFLLDRIAAVRGDIELTIAGPIEDHSYWEGCQRRIASMPANIRISYVGTVSHDEVPSLLAAHHFFALPTLGENFGHTIMEALGAGVGIVISDRTPWHHIETLGAGWDIPLDGERAWEAALQACCDMDDDSFRRISQAARRARTHFLDLDAIKRSNLLLFGANVPGRGADR